MLTIDSDGAGRCDSLYDRLGAYKCEYEKNRVYEFNVEFQTSMESGVPFEKNETIFTPLYENMTNCMHRYCYYNDEMFSNVNFIYNLLLNYTETKEYPTFPKTSSFDACLSNIILRDVSKYKCVRQMSVTLPRTSATTILKTPTVKLWRFLKDKECVRAVMEKECNWKNFATFDEDWKNYKTEMRDTRKMLTDY